MSTNISEVRGLAKPVAVSRLFAFPKHHAANSPHRYLAPHFVCEMGSSEGGSSFVGAGSRLVLPLRPRRCLGRRTATDKTPHRHRCDKARASANEAAPAVAPA